jgi:hypothetical protein
LAISIQHVYHPKIKKYGEEINSEKKLTGATVEKIKRYKNNQV